MVTSGGYYVVWMSLGHVCMYAYVFDVRVLNFAVHLISKHIYIILCFPPRSYYSHSC